MSSVKVARFGVKFLSRQERTVRRVTKAETREIKKRLEPNKPIRPKEPSKVNKPKKVPARPPATLVKSVKVPVQQTTPRRGSNTLPVKIKSSSSKKNVPDGPRILQKTDLEKLARLNCSREFSLFHQFIKSQLTSSIENQLAFLQTKLQHLKNEFVNKQAEHLNFEQIREYFNQAVQDNVRRQIKTEEFLTLAEKFRSDIRIAIEKWIRQKEIKPQKQVTEFLLRRQEKVKKQIKETIEEQKRQKLSGLAPRILIENCKTSNEQTEDDIVILN